MVSQLIMNPLIAMANASHGVKGADTILNDDPQGLIVALISISVVLTALLVLAVLIYSFSRVMIFISKRTAIETIEKNAAPKSAAAPLKPGEASGEIIAAISVALKLNKEALHDRESEIITINQVARVYSPWSSKLHGLTNMPR